MDYNKIILELFARIIRLEEEVTALKKGVISTEANEGEGCYYHDPYTKLTELLSKAKGKQITMTISDIERCIGMPLPANAKIKPIFWENDVKAPLALSWMRTGYKVICADLENQIIVFEK